MSEDSETVGPWPEARVASAIDRGLFTLRATVRDAQGGQWTPIGASPFAERFAGHPRRRTGLWWKVLIVALAVLVLGIVLSLVARQAEQDDKERAAEQMGLSEIQAEAQQVLDTHAAVARATALQQRERWAELVGERLMETESPPFVAGDEGTRLVPSADIMKCRPLAASWLKEVRGDLKALGFTEVACGFERWPL